MTNSSQNLEAIINAAADAIITADHHGRIAAWNPAAERLFGHTAEQAIGESVTLIVPERFRDAHWAGLQRVVETGETHIIGTTVDVFGLRRDGTEFPLALSLSTWVSNGERFFTGIARDMSERVEFIERLQKAETRVAAIVETANDAVINVDATGHVVLWNRYAEELFGRSAEEMVGQTLLEVIPERFRDLHNAGIARVAGGGDRHVIGQTVELAALRRDGTEFPIELSLAAAGEGEDANFTAILRDITERQQLIEGLRDSEARFSAIVQSANDAIISIDHNGEVLLWNPRAEELLGWSAEEMIGQSLTRIVPERFRQLHVDGVQRVASGGEMHVIGTTVELAALHRDGHELPVELSLGKWDSQDGIRFSGIVRDITRRKEAEARLREVNDELAEKNEQLEGLSAKLAKYLSRQVYDSIFTGRNEVRVESYRKKLTIFFSDIQGFTELSDRMEAEALSDVLNHYLSDMSDIATEFGGTIDKFIGDGIMIFFGDPESRGEAEDAIACVQMAIEMRNRIMVLKDEWQRVAGAVELHVRMGINTGYCTVGNFGSEERLDYTIVGREVNLASRLEQGAAPDQILISHDTRELVKERIACDPVGEITVRGMAYPVRTYAVLGHTLEGPPPDEGTPSDEETPSIESLVQSLDPSKLAPEQAEAAREALRRALGALEETSPGD
jgi:adenylate cyclase